MIRRAAIPLTASLLIAACASEAAPPRLPDFGAPEQARWINSVPLERDALRGRPVLVEFWTFGCHNCRNTLPWMKRVANRYANEGLAIVAVHTPEFPTERGRAVVAEAVKRLGVSYPVMLDDDSGFWSATGNRYWPAFYLFDGEGRLVSSRIGELHAGQSNADSFEAEIRKLLPPRTRDEADAARVTDTP